MSTEQKLAQMMIVALRSDADNSITPGELTPVYEDMLAKYDFGGIILFTGNIKDTEQTVADGMEALGGGDDRFKTEYST